jgi:hypothetical protein
VKYPDLFLDFISDLYFQIQEVPRDFFVDIGKKSLWLRQIVYTSSSPSLFMLAHGWLNAIGQKIALSHSLVARCNSTFCSFTEE